MTHTITFINGEPLKVPALEAYWRDPQPFEAERVRGQAAIDALFEDHRARVRAEQEARWAAEEAEANASTRSAWGMA